MILIETRMGCSQGRTNLVCHEQMKARAAGTVLGAAPTAEMAVWSFKTFSVYHIPGILHCHNVSNVGRCFGLIAWWIPF